MTALATASVAPAVDLQDCYRCGDRVATVSTSHYCDACVAELAPVDCPACEGRQEIQTGVDYFGEALTKTCPLCRGTGEVPAETAAWWHLQRTGGIT